MKTKRIALSAVSSVAFLAVLSCETHDPSAIGEIQRDLAEALAKNTRLEQEISSLNDQLDEAKRQPAPEPESAKMPSREVIEKSLAIEATKLQQSARNLHPNAQVEGISTFDLNIPSFETPFSCKAKVTLRDPSGSLKTLYWIGNANIKGEWKFEAAENLEPTLAAGNQAQQNPVNGQNTNSGNTKPAPAQPEKPKYDIPLDNPVMNPPGSVAPQNPNSITKPAPPAPAQPEKPKYDIPLDNPVMKPRGR
jgi:hypothetical protein